MFESKRIFIALPLLGNAMNLTLGAHRRLMEELIETEGWESLEWAPELAGNHHITLRFVGEIPTGEPMQELYDRLVCVVQQHPPLVVSLQQRGSFDKHPPCQPLPSILWVGVGGNMGLLRSLQADISMEVSELGHPLPGLGNDFTPHVTIGRLGGQRINSVRGQYEGQQAVHAWRNEIPMPPGHGSAYLVRDVWMYASERWVNGKVSYTRVGLPMPLNPLLLR